MKNSPNLKGDTIGDTKMSRIDRVKVDLEALALGRERAARRADAERQFRDRCLDVVAHMEALIANPASAHLRAEVSQWRDELLRLAKSRLQ